AGVEVDPPATGNSILGNSIYGSGGLGIELREQTTGVTLNDPGDTDTGANDLQNFPVITGVTRASGSTTITGTLSSEPNGTYRNRGRPDRHAAGGIDLRVRLAEPGLLLGLGTAHLLARNARERRRRDRGRRRRGRRGRDDDQPGLGLGERARPGHEQQRLRRV